MALVRQDIPASVGDRLILLIPLDSGVNWRPSPLQSGCVDLDDRRARSSGGDGETGETGITRVVNGDHLSVLRNGVEQIGKVSYRILIRDV